MGCEFFRLIIRLIKLEDQMLIKKVLASALLALGIAGAGGASAIILEQDPSQLGTFSDVLYLQYVDGPVIVNKTFTEGRFFPGVDDPNFGIALGGITSCSGCNNFLVGLTEANGSLSDIFAFVAPTINGSLTPGGYFFWSLPVDIPLPTPAMQSNELSNMVNVALARNNSSFLPTGLFTNIYIVPEANGRLALTQYFPRGTITGYVQSGIVPEPATMGLLGLGLAALAYMGRRRRS
jgi:hypothetical protein